MLCDPREGQGGHSLGFGVGGILGKQLLPQLGLSPAPKAPEQGLMQMRKIPEFGQNTQIGARFWLAGPGHALAALSRCRSRGCSGSRCGFSPSGGLREVGGLLLCCPSSLWGRNFPFGGSSVGQEGAFGGPWGDPGGWGGTGPPPQDRDALGGEGLPGAALAPHAREMGGAGTPRAPRDCPCGGRSWWRGRVTHLG